MKKVTIIFEKVNQEILVSIDNESCSSKELFDFLDSSLWTFLQKKSYNRKVKDIIKEYLIDMATCAKAIEQNNQIWEEKFEKNNHKWMKEIELLRKDHKFEIDRLNKEIKKLKDDK